MKLRETILSAAKAEAIPEAISGLWKITRLRLSGEFEFKRGDKKVILPAGCYTQLFRSTTSQPFDMGTGECVMEDSPFELRTHLDFMLRAFGDVLITGLGLGCVARGARVNPRVRSVTVIERDKHVLKMVAPYMPPGIEIIEAEAVEWIARTSREFDCTWNDVWTDVDAGEPHLAVRHAELIGQAERITKHFQGAWAFPRYYRRVYRDHKVM